MFLKFSINNQLKIFSGNSPHSSKAVEIVELSVPRTPVIGEDVELTCRFRLRGHNHRLYTVNWWRGKDQFFTYKTNSFTPKNAYNFRGIQVKVKRNFKFMKNLVPFLKSIKVMIKDHKENNVISRNVFFSFFATQLTNKL